MPVALSPKFNTELKKSLDDGVIQKTEARKLRQVALHDSPQLTDAYASKFESLQGKAADKVTGRYLATVCKEFNERSTARNAGTAIASYLKSHSDLSPGLAAIDANKPFVVGATLNRGVYLQVPIKDGATGDKTLDALKTLVQSEPSLKKYSGVWFL